MTGSIGPENLLRHDRWIVIGAILLAVATSAAVILAGGGTGMAAWRMSVDTGPAGALVGGMLGVESAVVWTPGYAMVIFFMWWLMMIAMMVPSATPVILLYGALHRERGARGALEFMAGYLAVWAAFSLLATVLQGVLAAGGQVSPMYMTLAAPVLGALVLIGAGAYQFTPLKGACLASCRGPVDALVQHRRSGRGAAFRMGLLHGSYCLGCCWALMALLFVGGVMNIWWILGITLYIAAEKLAPGGNRLARPLGAGLIVAGAALLVWTARLI